jgi:putative membrane protein insertion efficiency factor
LHVKRALIAVAIAPLRAYRRWVSPALPRRCKYEPTCSAYAEQAIRELGVLRGALVAARRLARCNPFSHGGYDPVEARSWFKSKPEVPV